MLRKTFHIFLAILVFVSSSGLVFSKHYCQGELKKIALFAEATSCHSAAKTKVCPRHSSKKPTPEVTDNNSCCTTVTDFLKNEDNQLSSVTELPVTDTTPIFALLPVQMLLSTPTVAFKAAHYLQYKPPLLVCDLPVRLQTFLC